MTKAAFTFLVALAVGQTESALIRFGVLRDRLSDKDVTQIAKLSSVDAKRPWLLDTSRSHVLPETWYVSAHLAPSTSSKGLRRGQLVVLASRVTGGTAQRWRVTDRLDGWAQVAVGSRAIAVVVTEDAMDRPFRVTGTFTDDDLVSLVNYTRASPRVPPLPPAPDGEVVFSGPNGLDGRLPILSVERRDAVWAEVWVGRTTGWSFRGDMAFRGGRWVLVSVLMGGIP